MATSGSIDYNQTALDIISDALTHLGKLGASESLSGGDYLFCVRVLNDLVKTWQAQGLHLFKKDEMSLFLQSGTQKYNLNRTSGDHAALNPVITTVASNITTVATSITVTSTTGMTSGDYIGIETDSNTVVWKTISSVGGPTSLTISSALGVASASGNKVFTYTTRANRPLEISSVRYRNASDVDRELHKMSRNEYFRISNKATTGEPMYYYYDPQVGTGELYVYPIGTDMSGYLQCTVSKSIEDFDSSTDNPDFPQEWIEVLKFNLAVRLASAYGATDKLTVLAPLAAELLQGVKEWDNEKASMIVTK